MYQTAPLLVIHQPMFLNAAIRISTNLDAPMMLELLIEIESRLGRQRLQRFGPRTIDLDILLWGARGERIVDTERLVLPHPRLVERAFALVPLAELAGDLVHPGCHRTIRELARESAKTGIELFEDEHWGASPPGE